MEASRTTFTSSRGYSLDTRVFQPDDAHINTRGIIVLVHGYGHHIDAFAEHFDPSLFVTQGFAVYGYSHFGHGQSDGLRAYIPRFDDLVEDLAEFVAWIRERLAPSNEAASDTSTSCPPVFLAGQSMGGAIVLSATAPDGPLYGKVAGTIMMSPMCKISKEMMLPDWQITAFSFLADWFPTLPLTPVPSTIDLCFKDPVMLQQAKDDPLGYHQRPRLKTGLELYRATCKIQDMLSKYDAPYLLLHGDADQVTDPAASKDLHEQAISSDKTMRMYEGMWHALLSEPDGGAERVRNDMLSWLLQHTSS